MHPKKKTKKIRIRSGVSYQKSLLVNNYHVSYHVIVYMQLFNFISNGNRIFPTPTLLSLGLHCLIFTSHIIKAHTTPIVTPTVVKISLY